MAGLLAPPPLQAGPPAAIAGAGPAAQRIYNSWIYAKGMVFAGTSSNSSARAIRWRNPYNVATQDSFLSSDSFMTNIVAMCAWVPSNALYIGTSNLDAVTHGNEVTITTCDLDAFASDTEIVAQVALGNLDSSSVSQEFGGMVTDGTYLYYLLCNTDQNSWIGKFQISNGSLVASIQLPNPTGGDAKAGSVLCTDGTNLYAAGGLSAGVWAAKVNFALSSATVLKLDSTVAQATPQAFVDSSNFYVGNYDASPGTFWAIPTAAFTTPVTYQVSRLSEGSPDGLVQAVDPNYFWVLQGFTGSIPTFTLYDKATVTPQAVVTGQATRSQFAAFMVPLPLGIFWITQPNSQSVKPFAGFQPTWTDLGVVPRPPVGRGSAW